MSEITPKAAREAALHQAAREATDQILAIEIFRMFSKRYRETGDLDIGPRIVGILLGTMEFMGDVARNRNRDPKTYLTPQDTVALFEAARQQQKDDLGAMVDAMKAGLLRA